MVPEGTMEVSVSDVSITNVGFAIFLRPQENKVELDTDKVVPIFIGPLETYSISSALEGAPPPRPNTHDLIINMLTEMESKVLHVVINDIIGNVFYARVVLQAEDGVVELDARPSDSVAIALRAKCPIYMKEKVFRSASVAFGDENYIKETGNEAESAPDEPPPPSRPMSELERMQSDLQQAVELDTFEQAAILRDKIKRLLQES